MKAILKGGKILNRGFKGVIINMYNDNPDDNHTLYKELLMNSGNKEISLITVDGSITLEDKDFDLILKLIKKRDKKVLVKKFVTSSFMFDSNAKNFNSEIEGYRQLIQIFKDNVTKYTTIKKGFSYKHKDIYGITFNNNYYVFLEKCFNTLDNIKFTEKTLAKCVKEIIEILDILNANNYIHNDIKPDNIILCRKRFKLIDWETSNYIKDQSSSFTNSKNGNLVFNHPIKFYRISVPYLFYRHIYDIEIMTYQILNKLQKPKEITALVESSYNQVVDKYSQLSRIPIIESKGSRRKIKKSLDISEIKENKDYYLKLADYFSFALCIIYLAERNKIDYPKKIIDNILSYYFIHL